MSVRLYKKEDRVRWDEYVMRSDSSSGYHSIGWKNLIESVFGHKTFYLLSEDGGGNINGILPLVHMKGLIFGNFMVSIPYFNYGGICSDDPRAGRELLDEAVLIAEREKAAHIELRQTEQLKNGLPVKTSKVSMLLDLPTSPEVLFKGFSSKLRSQIRRPEKEGMVTKIGGVEELEGFYHVFSINMRDIGTPVYPKEFFKSILNNFPENVFICTVYYASKPVASGFLTTFKERLEIPWASALRRYNQYSPNMLLYWSCLKFACEQGYKIFDFGRSTPGGNTFRFKEQWGAKPVQLYWHYWMKNERALPELNPNNPRFQLAIKIWQRLPVGLTKVVGPMIVKNLP